MDLDTIEHRLTDEERPLLRLAADEALALAAIEIVRELAALRADLKSVTADLVKALKKGKQP